MRPDSSFFVGVILLYLAWRLLKDFAPWTKRRTEPTPVGGSTLHLMQRDWRKMEFGLGEHSFGFSVPAMLALAFVVGIIGGTYGIGGGAIIAPFCIAIFRLPAAVVAGAALAGTFATSVIGVLVYSVLPLPGGGHAAPDWLLGSLFGLGGLAGMYLGAATQKHVPQVGLRIGLGLLLCGLGGMYLWPQ